MQTKALVIIDIQNDITKHYRDIVDNINAAIDWAQGEGMHVVYIKHNNITAATRTFKPGTRGEELAPELKVVSDNVFVKTKSNALTSEAFAAFIAANGINEFYVAGADATACVKSTCFNMAKAGFTVHVLSDCITSYDLKKLPEMLAYYESKGCEVKTLADMCYREEAIECVKDHVLQIHKEIYAKYNGDFDRIYTEGYNSKSYKGRVIEPGKVYELSYLECTCPKVKCGLRNHPQQCECSRQSILYILSQLEPDSHFEVRIENTILRGSDRCTFRITKS